MRSVFVESIEAAFVPDPQADEHGKGHPDRQPQNIDDRKKPVFQQASPGDSKIILEHKRSLNFHLLTRTRRKSQIQNTKSKSISTQRHRAHKESQREFS